MRMVLFFRQSEALTLVSFKHRVVAKTMKTKFLFAFDGIGDALRQMSET